MANANGTAPDAPAETQRENPLNWKFQRYDVSAIRAHNALLGSVAGLLEEAFHTSQAMESISEILCADAVELAHGKEDGGQPLSDRLRAGLLTASRVLSSDLHSKLCYMATKLEKSVVSASKGGE